MNAAITRAAGRALLGFVVLLAVLALVSGCVRKETDADGFYRIDVTYITKDPLTGCEYVGGAGGMHPRIGTDGKTHMGCGQGAKP